MTCKTLTMFYSLKTLEGTYDFISLINKINKIIVP